MHDIELFHGKVQKIISDLRDIYNSDFDRYTGLQDKVSERFFKLSTQITILMMTGWVALLSVGKIRPEITFYSYAIDTTYFAAFANILHVCFIGVMVYSNHLAAVMQTYQESRVTGRFGAQYNYIKSNYELALAAYAQNKEEDFLKFSNLVEGVSPEANQILSDIGAIIKPISERLFKIFKMSWWAFVASTMVSLVLLIISIKVRD